MSSAALLRICTWNTWHGLNPYQPILMLPVENPWSRYLRRKHQIEALRGLQASELDLFCLQEVNPVHSRRRLLEKRLGMKSFACLVNTGVKLNGLGLPPLLEDGLVTLAGDGFRQKTSRALTLSGSAPQYRGPLGISVSFQMGERRRALVFEAKAKGRSIAVVNLHLHHGPDTVAENLKRKKSELVRLARWLEPRLKAWDLLVVCGDFNCDPDSVVLRPLIELGLTDTLKLATNAKPIPPSWDPASNPWANHSSESASSPEARDWDRAPHFFDRIYLKSSEPLPNVTLKRVFDPALSDHFGLLAEIPLP